MTLIERFMALFRCSDRAYGTYVVQPDPNKVKQSGRAKTIYGKPSITNFKEHIKGKIGLGLIPINSEHNCYWGAIDIDEYPIDIEDVNRRIKELGYPFLACLTKSGGVHLYVFFNEDIQAHVLRPKLREMSSCLGYSGSEIFPKQDYLADERDVGNWINIPYFEDTRYCVYEGEQLSLEEFCDLAESKQISEMDFTQIKEQQFPELIDGPPCLQALARQGFPTHLNNSFLNLGVYCRMRYPDTWEQELEVLNQNILPQPLSARKVSNCLQSLNKSEYFYMCNQPPLVNLCNKELCKQRKFGIGNFPESRVILPESLTCLETKPRVWFVNIEGHSIPMSIEELTTQLKYRRLVAETIRMWPSGIKQVDFDRHISKLMDSCEVIQAPEETSPFGHFELLLHDFCTTTNQGQALDDILRGMVFIEDGTIYFKPLDLLSFIQEHGFREYGSVQALWVGMHSLNVSSHKTSLKGRQTRYWSMPMIFERADMYDIPEIEEDDF